MGALRKPLVLALRAAWFLATCIFAGLSAYVEDSIDGAREIAWWALGRGLGNVVPGLLLAGLGSIVAVEVLSTAPLPRVVEPPPHLEDPALTLSTPTCCYASFARGDTSLVAPSTSRHRVRKPDKPRHHTINLYVSGQPQPIEYEDESWRYVDVGPWEVYVEGDPDGHDCALTVRRAKGPSSGCRACIPQDDWGRPNFTKGIRFWWEAERDAPTFDITTTPAVAVALEGWGE